MASRSGFPGSRISPIPSRLPRSSQSTSSMTPPSRRRCCTTPSRIRRPRARKSISCLARISAGWSKASRSSKGSTLFPGRPSRPRTCASCCWPVPRTYACCWSSLRTGCTTCAPSNTCGRKRGAVSQETIDIYAPLAGRIGMYELREELESLAFRELNPEAHKVVGERLEALEKRHLGLIAEIETQLTRKLATRGIAAAVKGRRKRPYSIWRKMERKAVGFEQLSDIFGFRVMVKTMPECYQALGVVHTTWPVVPGRFKDYVSTPKQNDYRSIHTTVIGPSQQRVELQIRTLNMDEIAEYGIAAHALYKDGIGSPTEK